MSSTNRIAIPGQPAGLSSAQSVILRGQRNGEPIDVDERDQQNHLHQAMLNPAASAGVVGAGRKRLAARQVQGRLAARLQLQHDLERQMRLSGQERDIRKNSLAYLRNRHLPPEDRLPDWNESGRRGAFAQTLSMASAERALERLQQGDDDAQADFVAGMFPLPGFHGNARELARRFYDAADDREREQLLQDLDLEPEERKAVLEDLKASDAFEEVVEEEGKPRKRMTYSPNDFAARLARHLKLGDLDQLRHDAALLQADCFDRRAQIENDGELGESVRSTAHIADVLEEVGRDGSPEDFADRYAELVLGEDNWSSKSLQAAQLYVGKNGQVDLQRLQAAMLATSRAAGLDMEARRDPQGRLDGEDRARLQAAIESTKLIARLSSAAARVDDMRKYLERAFGMQVDGSTLLTGMLERMASPHSQATSFLELARRLGAGDAHLAPTLVGIATFIREMPVDMFPDLPTRAACKENLQLALDEAARLEDERLQQEGLDDSPAASLPAPTSPALPEPAARRPSTRAAR